VDVGAGALDGVMKYAPTFRPAVETAPSKYTKCPSGH
jgi:hypothetical protein